MADKLFEVMYSIYDQDPNTSSYTSGLTLNMNQKMVVQAFDASRARAQVQAMFGKNCKTFGVFEKK